MTLSHLQDLDEDCVSTSLAAAHGLGVPSWTSSDGDGRSNGEVASCCCGDAIPFFSRRSHPCCVRLSPCLARRRFGLWISVVLIGYGELCHSPHTPPPWNTLAHSHPASFPCPRGRCCAADRRWRRLARVVLGGAPPPAGAADARCPLWRHRPRAGGCGRWSNICRSVRNRAGVPCGYHGTSRLVNLLPLPPPRYRYFAGTGRTPPATRFRRHELSMPRRRSWQTTAPPTTKGAFAFLSLVGVYIAHPSLHTSPHLLAC